MDMRRYKSEPREHAVELKRYTGRIITQLLWVLHTANLAVYIIAETLCAYSI